MPDTAARLLEEVQALIAHPTSNLTAASLLLAIIVIAVLTFLIVALLLLTADRAHTATRKQVSAPRLSGAPLRPTTGRLSADDRRFAIWAIVAAVAVVSMATYAYSARTEYCASSCHSMTPATDTWESSTHMAVDCVSCHESSIPGAISSRLRHIVSEMTGAREGALDATIESQRCASCHPETLKTAVIESGVIRVAHVHFAVEGMSCIGCHGQVGHTETSGLRDAVMDRCLRCHDGQTASTECTVCHVGDIGASALEDRTFGRVRLPEPTCGGCHDERTCDACHGLRMPHSGDFTDPRAHARGGAFSGRTTLCYRCHVPADCDACHVTLTLSGGHAANWRTAHRKYSRADGRGYCLACHKTQDFCTVCHP